MKFKKLFEPGNIGRLRVKNRIIQAPMWTAFAARDGLVTTRLLNYYRERARGGVGLIIVEFASIDGKASVATRCQLGIYNESFIPGLSTLARVIKDNGAKAGIQICHCGRQRFLATYPMVAPSPVPWKALGGIVPSELTIEEIEEIIEAFGNAARIAEKSGFDLVEIHGGHGYLINQFLSPYTNRRTDIYGGSLRNRMRFALEVVQRVREKVSHSFPVGMRISGSEYIENGVTIDESVVLAKELEEAGIDIIHVSGGNHEASSFEVAPEYRPLALHAHLAEAIKRAVHIPVVASGSITSPQLAEEILEKEQADFVSLARPLLADPYFAKKAEEGRSDDIVPCIRCRDGCLLRGVNASRAIGCTVNFSVGFEGEFDLEPARECKSIAVIGGGPAGMEAARVAASRGHKVTLYEQRDQLGGHLLEASVPVFKNDLKSLIRYFKTQLEKLNVKVVLKVKATDKIIKEQEFDAVVLAIGSIPLVPKIKGIDKRSVVTAVDVLNGRQVGQNVLVAGGGLVGCEVAWFLAEQGKKVCVIEAEEDIAPEMDIGHKQVIFEKFSQYKVQVLVGSRLEEVTDAGVIVVDRGDRRRNLEVDNVVLALGFEPRKNPLSGDIGIPVYLIGDCVKPRKIYDAIHEGFLTGYKI